MSESPDVIARTNVELVHDSGSPKPVNRVVMAIGVAIRKVLQRGIQGYEDAVLE